MDNIQEEGIWRLIVEKEHIICIQEQTAIQIMSMNNFY